MCLVVDTPRIDAAHTSTEFHADFLQYQEYRKFHFSPSGYFGYYLKALIDSNISIRSIKHEMGKWKPNFYVFTWRIRAMCRMGPEQLCEGVMCTV